MVSTPIRVTVHARFETSEWALMPGAFVSPPTRPTHANPRTYRDTAGQERFRTLQYMRMYKRNAAAAVVTYDITTESSFAAARELVTDLQSDDDCASIPIALAANKSDLEHLRVVPRAAADAFAASCGVTHQDTSAKNGGNVRGFFAELAAKLPVQQEELRSDTVSLLMPKEESAFDCCG